jgi:nucleoside-diphosphate-sugar epimerase
MTETLLVIGGTGEFGGLVARQLRDDGYRVRVLVRRLPAARDRHPGLEVVQRDLDDSEALAPHPCWLCRGAPERARPAQRRVPRSSHAVGL